MQEYLAVVRIDHSVHKRFLTHCKRQGLVAGGIVSRLVAEYLRNPSSFTSVVQHKTKSKEISKLDRR